MASDFWMKPKKAESLILFLASRKDDLARCLDCELVKRARRIQRLDENDVFSTMPFAFKRSGRDISGHLRIDGESIPLQNISGAFVRFPREWWPGGEFDVQDQMFVYHETTAAWFNLLTYLSGPVINRFSLGWWLHDLNYPLLLGKTLSEQLDIPMVPLEPFISYGVRLLPSNRDVSPNSASIYLVGKELVSATEQAKAVLPLLLRRRVALARWQHDNDVSFCRLDFDLNRKPLLKFVETFPLFENETKSVVENVVSTIADIFYDPVHRIE
jgi:hypothetical protein